MEQTTLFLGVISVLWGLLLLFGGWILRRIVAQLDHVTATATKLAVTVGQLQTHITGEIT